MLIPIRTDCPLRTTPYVNYVLIGLNVAVFAVQQLAAAGVVPLPLGRLALDPGEPQVLHFVTYAFLHGGYLHIIGNMVFLYIFGNNVCDKMGPWAYLAFYLGGAVFAGIAYVLLAQPVQGNVYAPVVGASGAVAAVTGAYLVLFPRSQVTVLLLFIVITFFQVPGLLLVAFFFARDVIFELFGASTNVAHTAHIAGTLFGVAVALGLLATRLLDRDQFDLLALITRWNRRRQYRAAVASGWNPYGTLPSEDEPTGGGRRRPPSAGPADPRETQIMEMRAQVSEAMAHRNLPGAAELYRQLRQIDPGQVLSRNAQLDIANQLAEMAYFRDAAEAYELFLRTYPTADQVPHVELLTGILYARYLDRPTLALERIDKALPRLTSPRDIELARQEQTRLRHLLSSTAR
ncbi:MAG: rhomboid family intramembrane serine protease [Tepidisphaerales bacterium]